MFTDQEMTSFIAANWAAGIGHPLGPSLMQDATRFAKEMHAIRLLLRHSSDKLDVFLMHKKLLVHKKWGNCVVFSNTWISTALAVEEASVLAYKTVHLGFEQHCGTMSLFDADLFVILLIQL